MTRLPNALTRFLLAGARRVMASRPPDLIIGGETDPYMLRWHLLPRNPIGNLYIHEIRRSDDDRALHDHPWPSLSLILSGYYSEVLGDARGDRPGDMRWCGVGSMIFRAPRFRHRLALPIWGWNRDPVVTLFLVGPRLREWGFWCPRGFVPWRDFVTPNDRGTIGRGCGDA